MKINLLLNSDQIRNDFLNIDPLAPNNTIGDITNLDDLVDDAEATEFIALDVIDYLPPSALDAILTNWLKKIRHGGLITIGGVDIMQVAKALYRQEVSMTEANILLYGRQSAPWEYRKTTLTMGAIIGILQQNNFKIIQKRMEIYHYIVKAERL